MDSPNPPPPESELGLAQWLGASARPFASITIDFMVLTQTLQTSSEAPIERAAALVDLLDSLHLREERLTPTELEHVVVEVAARPDLWRDLVVDSPDRRWWLVLFRSANYELRLLSWELDQTSDWHDHGGSSGGFSVVDGSLHERYRTNAGAEVCERRLSAGAAGCFGPAHVHDMVHASGRPAVSIHAYSPPLTVLTTYEETPYGLVVTGVRFDDDRE